MPKAIGSHERADDGQPLSAARRSVVHIVRTVVRLAEWAPLRFALVTTLALVTLAVVILRPSYETCDDVFMTMIASGKGLAAAPDEHLVFTNVLVGHALKRLYAASPGIPWYGGYLLLVHWLAQAALLYVALVIGRVVEAVLER